MALKQQPDGTWINVVDNFVQTGIKDDKGNFRATNPGTSTRIETAPTQRAPMTRNIINAAGERESVFSAQSNQATNSRPTTSPVLYGQKAVTPDLSNRFQGAAQETGTLMGKPVEYSSGTLSGIEKQARLQQAGLSEGLQSEYVQNFQLDTSGADSKRISDLQQLAERGAARIAEMEANPAGVDYYGQGYDNTVDQLKQTQAELEAIRVSQARQSQGFGDIQTTQAQAAEQAVTQAQITAKKAQGTAYTPVTDLASLQEAVKRDAGLGGFDKIAEDGARIASERDEAYNRTLSTLERQRNAEIERKVASRLANVDVSSTQARKDIEAQIRAQITAEYENPDNRYNLAIDDLKFNYENNKEELERNIQEARQKFVDSQRLSPAEIESSRANAEFQSFVQQELFKDPTLTQAYLKNKWTAINKYDSGGESSLQIGSAVDRMLETGQVNAEGFSDVIRAADGNMEEAYKGLKSRVGIAKADQVKNEHLAAMGYDEETIMAESRATLAGELYRGEEKSSVALAKFVKDAEALGLPDELIQSELEQIAESDQADFQIKAAASFYAKSLAGDEDRDIRTVDGTVIEITPEGVKELYKSGGSVDESMLFENASRDEQRQTTQIMRQLPTKLKDSEQEKAARQNEILADLREGRDVQDILDELNGFLVLDDNDLSFATGMRVLATGSDASLADISAAINRGDKLQPILTVENAKMSKYDTQDFNQASVANIVQEQEEILDLIEAVGENFMGAVDSRLFSADSVIRNRAITEAGIQEGDEAFAAATSLGAKMARVMAEDRKSFGGTALTDTEAKFLAPMIAEMKDQPASAAVKVSEMANAALQKHNFYRQKEGLPVFTSVDQILDDEDKIRLYETYTQERFPKSSPAESGDKTNSFLIEQEGVRTEAYLDSAGIPTIGVGFTQINGRPVQMGDTMTMEEIEAELPNQIENHTTFKNKVKVDLTPNQKEALASFEYNLGSGIWDKNAQGIIDDVNNGDFESAAKKMLVYNKAKDPETGKLREVRGLTLRRQREAELLKA